MHPLLQTLQKHREGWILFGSGLLAGLLFFLAWWAMQPSLQSPEQATAPATMAAGKKPDLAADGVLGDITGDSPPGRARDVSGPEVSLEEMDSISVSPAQDGYDTRAREAQAMTDEQAIAGGLLGSDEPPPPLQTYYVEIMSGPNVSEQLELEASSPEHALRILRDFRGNPRVVNGPSSQPLP